MTPRVRDVVRRRFWPPNASFLQAFEDMPCDARSVRPAQPSHPAEERREPCTIRWVFIELDHLARCHQGGYDRREWRPWVDITRSMTDTGRRACAREAGLAMLTATRHLRTLGEDVLWRLIYEITGHAPATTGVVRVQAYLVLRWAIHHGVRMRQLRQRSHGARRFYAAWAWV